MSKTSLASLELEKILEETQKYAFLIRDRKKLEKMQEIKIDDPPSFLALLSKHPKKQRLIIQFLIEKEHKIPSSVIFNELEGLTFGDPYLRGLLTLLYKLARDADVPRLMKLITSDLHTFLDQNSSALDIIIKFVEMNGLSEESCNIFEDIILTHKDYNIRESAVWKYASLLPKSEIFQKMKGFFDKGVHWGVQRKIVDIFSHKVDISQEIYDFLIENKKRPHLNFGVAYNIWNFLFKNHLVVENPRIMEIGDLVLAETSENVILGYGSDYSGRYGGILNQWILMANSHPDLMQSLVVHKKSYVADRVFRALRKEQDQKQQFKFFKCYVNRIMGAGIKPRLNRLLNIYSDYIDPNILGELLEFLEKKNLRSTTLYYKTIVLKETEEPYLSVKFGVVGIGQCGKTAISYYLKNNKAIDTTHSTYGIEMVKIPFPHELINREEINIKPKAIAEIKLFDFGGQDFFWASHKFYFQKIEGFIVVFTGLSDGSQQKAIEWIQKIHQYYDEFPLLFLVRNQIDRSFGELYSSFVNQIKEISPSSKIYNVCANADEHHLELNGKGIKELKEDLFKAINWPEIQAQYYSGEILEIVSFIREHFIEESLYIQESDLLSQVEANFPHHEPNSHNDNLQISLLKLEKDGDLLRHYDFIILDLEKFSIITSQLCKMAQDNNGFFFEDQLIYENFKTIFPEELPATDIQYLLEKIMAILIQSESCFPDFLKGKKVFIFYEDIRDELSSDIYYSKTYDFINWLLYDSHLKTGEWEKMIARISITFGITPISIWKNAINLQYKNHNVFIRRILLNKKKFKIGIEILITGYFSPTVGGEIQNLIIKIIQQEFKGLVLKNENSNYYSGKYEEICEECDQTNQYAEHWLIPFIKRKIEHDCHECSSDVAIISLQRHSFPSKQPFNLYRASQESYDLKIRRDYINLPPDMFEFADYIADGVKNHLSPMISQILIGQLKAEKMRISMYKDMFAIIPLIKEITTVSEDEYDLFLLIRDKGFAKFRIHFNNFMQKLKLKKFLKIEFQCAKCKSVYPFLLILKQNPKYKKILKFTVGLILKWKAFDSQTEMWEKLDEINSFTEKISDMDKTKVVEFKDFSAIDKKTLIDGLHGLDHLNHLYDIFSGIHWIGDEFYLKCNQCH